MRNTNLLFRILLLAGLAPLPLACGDDDKSRSQTLDARESADLIQGIHLSSQFVDDSQWYLGRRSIDLLVDLGALTPLQEQVARRADGIIRNGEPNGSLGAEELAALEQSATWDSLFPDERAAVPSLWALLVLDAPVVVDSPCELTGPLTTIYDEPFTPPSHFVDIPSLPAAQRALAERIQLQHDSDADPTTLSGSDVLRAHENVGAYLPDEAKLLPDLFAALHDELVAPEPGVPRHQVPDQSCDASFTSMEVAFEATMDQVLARDAWRLNSIGGTVRAPSVANVTEVVATPLQAGDQVVVHSFPTGTETTTAGGALSIEVPRFSEVRNSRRVQVEVWRGGTRVEHLELDLGGMAPTEEVLPYFLPLEIDGAVLYPKYGGQDRNVVALDPSPPPQSWTKIPPPPQLEIEPGTYRNLDGHLFMEMHDGGWVVFRNEDGALSLSLPVSLTDPGKPDLSTWMVFRANTERVVYEVSPYLSGYQHRGAWLAPTW